MPVPTPGDDASGHQPGRLGQRLLRIKRGIWKLVEPAGEAHDLAGLLHAADRGGGDARRTELREPRHPPPLEQRQRLGALGRDLGGGHVVNPRANQRSVRGFIPLRSRREQRAVHRHSTADSAALGWCCRRGGSDGIASLDGFHSHSGTDRSHT